MDSIQNLAGQLLSFYHHHHRAARIFTVALSGIDASGKGFVTEKLEQELQPQGYYTAVIHTDPWQHPLRVRLNPDNPARTIYDTIFRWDDFFTQLVIPMQQKGSLYLETTGIHSHADIYYPLVYDFKEIDILLVEGILLLKRDYLSYYDCRIWIDCSFEKGLERALERNVEKRSREQLISDYATFYYPAQRLHFQIDNPRQSADIIFDNR